MSKRKSVREFLTEVQQKLSSDQTYWVRICDLDKYEHLSFYLRKDTDFDGFADAFDQDILDADVSKRFYWSDEEEGDTIFITADIEL